jgi:acyl carrier protein
MTQMDADEDREVRTRLPRCHASVGTGSRVATMGIDILDLIFRLERTFGVKIPRSEFALLALKNEPIDLVAGDLFEYVRRKARLSGVRLLDDETDSHLMWPLFQKAVSDALGVEPGEVTKESWLIRDLGMS